jgi:Mn-dependent DtxR family transcriptional regulator
MRPGRPEQHYGDAFTCDACGHESYGRVDRSLSRREGMTLAFITGRISERDQPTLRQIADQLGWSSVGTVTHVLSRLMRKGVLARDGRRALTLVGRR